MTRATPLPPEERRASLIEATLPLLLTHGPSLTTKQVAEAAGVAEGTIFRVFPALAELIDATTREALSAERLQRDIAAVEVGGSLRSATEAALGLLVRRMRDIGRLLHGAHHSGGPESSPGFDTTTHRRTSSSSEKSPGFDTVRRANGLNQRQGASSCLRDELEARQHEFDAWLVNQLEPHVHELSIKPLRYVEFLRTVALGHTLAHDTTLTVGDLAQLALHGAGKAR